MSTHEFHDDDAGYLAWLTAHPDDHVVNIALAHNATTTRLHHAGCPTIGGQNPRRGPWTGAYVKIGAEHLAELQQWNNDHVSEPILRCRTCNPIEASHGPLQPN